MYKFQVSFFSSPVQKYSFFSSPVQKYSFFSSPVQKYRELLLSSLALASASALAWAFMLHLKVLGQSFTLKFLCNGQVAARQAFWLSESVEKTLGKNNFFFKSEMSGI